jgi:CRISPR-associated exonuclease Cas4
VFAAEQAKLTDAFQPIRWVYPSEADEDLVQFEASGLIGHELPLDAFSVTAGGSLRGIILHKLMEEVITGELDDSVATVQDRAAVLVAQLAPGQPAATLHPQELAQAVRRTIALPELSDRAELVAEVPVYGVLEGDPRRLVSGRSDAVRYRDGRPCVVFDWKSDINPTSQTRLSYAQQLALYIDVLGADRGAVVYMTSGQIEWVNRAGQQT